MSAHAGAAASVRLKARPRLVNSRPAAESQAPRIDAGHLERYCYLDGDGYLGDLTKLLAQVRSVDRSVRRHYSQGWARELEVRVEVANPSFWRKPELVAALSDALNFLTGDAWSFKFVKRARAKVPSQAHLLEAPNQERVFMPFSNGLDSVAIAHELEASDDGLELVLVNVQARDKPTNWKNLGRPSGRPFKSLQVTSFSPDPHNAEPTFRSRPFLFDLLAGYGAARSQPAYVVIPENGQGSLGGSLVPLGAEAPHRSCHPAFTKRLTKVVELITGVPVVYDHPALFRTKGQVLKGLSERLKSQPRDWLTHRSCSHDARHASQGKQAMHCGTCGNCLLRRVSLRWAGVEDSTKYRAVDLHAPSLRETFAGDAPKNLSALTDLALNSVRSMHRMANLADDTDGLRVQAEVAALARGLNESNEVVTEKMESFLKQHQTEWYQFLNFCGPKSWVAQLARV
jgi:hypothetical protein